MKRDEVRVTIMGDESEPGFRRTCLRTFKPANADLMQRIEQRVTRCRKAQKASNVPSPLFVTIISSPASRHL
jgi:hypothetical protein